MKRVILAVGLIAGCGGDAAPITGTGSTMTMDIGAAGGEIELEGAALTIPAGALGATTSITITSTTDAAPGGYTNLSPIYRFAPDGLVFETPVTATIAYVDTAATPTLFWSRPDDAGYDALDGEVAGGHVTASVLHFSDGFVGVDATPDVDGGGDCPVGQTSCGGVCTDTQTDPLHCGSCTTVCQVIDGGAACFNGVCVAGAR